MNVVFGELGVYIFMQFDKTSVPFFFSFLNFLSEKSSMVSKPRS